jgi:4a-hydroxytetrahydrobiopterin dehydratase
MSTKTPAELALLHCAALRGAEHRMSDAQNANLLAQFPSWKIVNSELVRECKFANYYETMAFVNALAFIAHREDHHPDLSVHYNRVQVRFSTHDVGGLSLNDWICVAKCEGLLAL